MVFSSESEFILKSIEKTGMGPEYILLLRRPYTISYCRLKWENGPMCQNLSAFQHSCGLLNVYVADGNSGEIQGKEHMPCWAKRKGSSAAFPLCCSMNQWPYCPEAKKLPAEMSAVRKKEITVKHKHSALQRCFSKSFRLFVHLVHLGKNRGELSEVGLGHRDEAKWGELKEWRITEGGVFGMKLFTMEWNVPENWCKVQAKKIPFLRKILVKNFGEKQGKVLLC